MRQGNVGKAHAADVLVLGAGLAGLAAAAELGEDATVLERAARPGGLARSQRVGDCWFDDVLHVLYFPDDATEATVRALAGDHLAPCPPEAWVETAHGTARFPIQHHVGTLDEEMVTRCLHDFAEATVGEQGSCSDFEQLLLATFGRALCDLFFFPYNRKMWKRPLAELAPSGFQWNIARPSFDEFIRGVLAPHGHTPSYNANGWYPRPPADSPLRGMEVLSAQLAEHACDLRLGHEVVSIDLTDRTVTTRCGRLLRSFRYHDACCATLPLPAVIELCEPVPSDLRRACRELRHNRALSVMLSIRGERPVGRGHWRYYVDESLVFNRLIYPHEFDPLCAPAGAWGLMAEITEPAERRMASEPAVIERVVADARRAGALPADCHVIDAQMAAFDPAYVVFTPAGRHVVEWARGFLADRGVHTLGRYGRWEYSSMGQVMRDALEWVERREESAGLAPAVAPGAPRLP